MKIDKQGYVRIDEPGRAIVLAPGDTLAEEVLTEDELKQARRAWTPELVAAHKKSRAQRDTEPATVPLSVEERVDALERWRTEVEAANKR